MTASGQRSALDTDGSVSDYDGTSLDCERFPWPTKQLSRRSPIFRGARSWRQPLDSADWRSRHGDRHPPLSSGPIFRSFRFTVMVRFQRRSLASYPKRERHDGTHSGRQVMKRRAGRHVCSCMVSPNSPIVHRGEQRLERLSNARRGGQDAD